MKMAFYVIDQCEPSSSNEYKENDEGGAAGYLTSDVSGLHTPLQLRVILQIVTIYVICVCVAARRMELHGGYFPGLQLCTVGTVQDLRGGHSGDWPQDPRTCEPHRPRQVREGPSD